MLIVSYNTRDLLLDAVASVLCEPEVEVVVVDNASRDGSAAAVAERFPSVRLIASPRNLGFAAGTNLAARQARGRHLLLLNPDAALTPGALDRLLAVFERHPRVGAAGPALVYGDGRAQPSAFRFPDLSQVVLDLFPVPRLMDSPLNGRLSRPGRAQCIDHPLGACMLIGRAAWDDVGPLDEGYFMYLEEVDWCRRAAARGWRTWYEPAARAVHHAGSATRQRSDAMFEELWRSRLRYYQRFHGPLFNRLVHAIVRLGMAAESRRASPARRRAAAVIRNLAR
ncbi:MAG: glycosyltransferase family 2 protein [Chloroflexota bacterium]|nr:glycosyltransferase family 2 protein [Chloroflexota bacterium]